MGKSRSRKFHRDAVVFPKTAIEAVDLFGDVRPRLRRKGSVLLSEATHKRLPLVGHTPEEILEQYAPEGFKLSHPEKRVFGWLVRHGIVFDWQVQLMGGRIPGGAIVDFVVYTQFPPIILRIQSYWHEATSTRVEDDLQRVALENMGYQVEDVWEYDLQTEDEVHWTLTQVIYGWARPGGGMVIREYQDTCPYCNYRDCVKCIVGEWYIG